MSDAQKRTVTVKQIKGKAWNKPDSNQYWYSVVIEEHPSEPIKFIQDRDKQAPEPKVGEQYTGNVYASEKGLKFYPFAPKHDNKSGNGFYDSDGQAWGNAISNATQLVINVIPAGTDLQQAIELTLATAQQLFEGRYKKEPDVPENKPEDKAEPVEEVFPDSEPVDLKNSDIPF